MTKLKRKDFLRLAALAPSSVHWPSWMPRLSFAPTGSGPRGDTLVVVFLRGAADALNILVPHGEEAYYQARPTLAIGRPDDSRYSSDERAIDIDGFFGLHPKLASLLPAMEEGQLGIVQACGAPDESRSHFKAMELMERGVSDEHGPASGWIGRHLSGYDTGNSSPLRAIGLGASVARSLHGSVPVSALRSITDFHLGGDSTGRQLKRTLRALHTNQENVSSVGQETLNMLDTLEELNPADYKSVGEAAYPQSEFGSALLQVAMLIKAEVGLEVAAIDVGGWDTHFAQGSENGLMANLLSDLGAGLAAFHADLEAQMGSISLVVMSEFGRRVHENASLGTDHGHGTMMMLMGGNLTGGKVMGEWPGLEEGSLFGPGDLAVTSDYRDVLAEVISKRLNNSAIDRVFPGYSPVIRDFLK